MDKNELTKVLCQHQMWLEDAGGKRAILIGADLRGADLSGADLSGASLYGADLRGADLSGASLYGADLSDANLSGANLYGADLCSADLIGAKLDDVEYNHKTGFFALQCPEEGSFIGYKKACNHIIKLEILPDAKRSSATTRKCRCSSAKVLSITTLDGQDDGTQTVSSDYDNSFEYHVGEIVRVDDFDDNRWRECSRGIHFFMTRDEAVRYN